MTASAHALIGTVIAAKIGNPALGIPLAILSHIVADSIPHWDTATNGHHKGSRKRVLFYNTIADTMLGFILSYLLIFFFFPQTNLPYALLLIIMAQLFDWLMVPYYFFGIDKPLFKLVYNFQKLFNKDLDKPWGVITQISFVLLLILLGIFS